MLKPEHEKILLMDGDEASRSDLEKLLRGAGYEVSTSEFAMRDSKWRMTANSIWFCSIPPCQK